MHPPSWLGTDWLSFIYISWLAQGALLTTTLSLAICIAASIWGTILAALLESRWHILRYLIQFILSLHRNTPLIVQLLLWYFAFPHLLSDNLMQWLNTTHIINLPFNLHIYGPSFEILTAFIALTLYSASFITGELRAGLRGVSQNQRHAGQALGMRHWQVFRWIVLPQALVFIRRPLMGQYTHIIKNTSLTMAIGVAELSYRTRQVEAETLLTFQAFAIATLFYLLMIVIVQYQRRQPKSSTT